MALSKPTEVIGWGNAGTAPTGGQKTAGFSAADRPPAAWFNWAWKTASDWFAWLNQYFTTSGTSNRDLAITPTALGALTIAGGTGTGGIGGGVTIAGGASESGTNKDGGDLILSGGATTGNASTKVTLKAAVAGSSGTGANSPATFLECNGSTGRVEASKELNSTVKISATNTVTGASVAAYSTSGAYGQAAIETIGGDFIGTGEGGIGLYAKGGTGGSSEGVGGPGPGILAESSEMGPGVTGLGGAAIIGVGLDDMPGIYGTAQGDGYGVVGDSVNGPGVWATSNNSAALRIDPRSGDPTETIQNGDIWVTATAIRVKIGGTLYTINVTAD